MINNGLKFSNNLYLEAKNENMSRYEGYIYKITLSYNIRDDNAVLISLITKKRTLSNYGGYLHFIF